MKQKVKERIHTKIFKSDQENIRFSYLPKNIQDDDIIEIHRVEPFNSEKNSYDSYTELMIIRERDETDEEQQKRISDIKKFKEELRKSRYEQYIKLKSEFEPQ